MRALALIVASLPAWALAQPADLGVPPSCAAVEREREEARRALKACSASLRTASERGASCAEDLQQATEKLNESTQAAQSCQTSRAELCTATGGLVSGVIAGRLHTAGVSGCVTPEQQSDLQQLLGGWAHVQAVLSALAAYGAGESDAVPRGALSGTAIERTVARILQGRGAGPPILYRRLLVEALEQVTPRAWRRLRASGAAGLDAWFTSSARLDDALVREAQAADASPSGDGPKLSTALRLVEAYQVLAGCETRPSAARGCVRAQQLEELLETSGPLVVRRRVQDIWSIECGHITWNTTLGWLQDFPTPHLHAGRGEWKEVTQAAFAKLYACFLVDAEGPASFEEWVSRRLPGPDVLNSRTLQRLEEVRHHFKEGNAYDRCGRAARALETLPAPVSCRLPDEARVALLSWQADPASRKEAGGPALKACATLVRDLWEGKPATIPASFARPPLAAEMVVQRPNAPETQMARLRGLCDRRAGTLREFPDDLRTVAGIARGFGEPLTLDPWRADARAGGPIEALRFASAVHAGAWLKHLASRNSTCGALELAEERCKACLEAPDAPFYDCALMARLQKSWDRRTRALGVGFVAGTAGVLMLVWLLRLRRAFRDFGGWAKTVKSSLESIAVVARPDPLRYVLPSRLQSLTIELPDEPAWERWGRRAGALRAAQGGKVTERDVNRAAAVAQSLGAEVALLVHDEGASPDLPAVRAMLEWAARGSRRAVQILPISTERLKWARSADDLLDLVEESSLRGNPFEVRGRITSSSQFFDRERLVSGLLAGAQAGHWLVVTGLRRFGKSSLSLEVARRLPGPSAYVDLAGFHHEIAFVEPARAADAILRYLCSKLHESARARYRSAELPEPPAADASLDSAELSRWFSAFTAAVTRAAGGRAPSVLLVLDEIEQAIGVGPERLGRALDVLSILIGRLRNSLVDSVNPPAGARIGLLLCSALHPLLWAPLSTLAHQSIMGSFQHVCVPRLPTEAALAMMRGLGARQGIRFTDAALEHIVREALGVPLLVRRIGSSVLELYDPERARQGSLGAVEIGIEGASAAVRREEEEGSPLRVWVESEIADTHSPAGVLLRRLAREGQVATATLRAIAAEVVVEQFERTGIAAALSPDEVARRSQEAASVFVRLLGDTGLLVPVGDLTNPEAYSFPDCAIRRVLCTQRAQSVFGL